MSQPTWIGHRLNNRYEITELLGHGGMSSVFKAVDRNLKRAVAVKLIHSHLSTDPEFVRRFEAEATSVAQLRHTNIIQVFDFDREGTTYYMVLEFIPGETLQFRLKRLNVNNRKFSLDEVLKFSGDICDAINYAHKRDMVHRDIKPANIMLTVQGEAILMDFGIVKIIGEKHHTATGAVLGTALYMSPEQVRGDRPDHRADIYSLGVTLFEMVSGRPPFEADSAMSVMMMHLNDPVPDIESLNPDVPTGLKAIIEDALAKDPNDRFQSAQEMKDALNGLMESLTPTQVAPPQETVPAPPPTRETIQPSQVERKTPVSEPAEVQTPVYPAPIEKEAPPLPVPEPVSEKGPTGPPPIEEEAPPVPIPESTEDQEATELAPVEQEPPPLPITEPFGEKERTQPPRIEEESPSFLKPVPVQEWETTQPRPIDQEIPPSPIPGQKPSIPDTGKRTVPREPVAEPVIERRVVKTLQPKDGYPRGFAIVGISLIGLVAIITGIFLVIPRLNRPEVEPVTPTNQPAVAMNPTEAPTENPTQPIPTNIPELSPTPAPTDTPIPTPEPVLDIGSSQISPVDDMVQVFVPAGEFLMGAPDIDPQAEDDEKPAHLVYLDAFWIDQTEVTNGMYALCVAAGACQPPQSMEISPGTAYYGNTVFVDHPVVHVDWSQARDYCEWAGRRLPTEAEWEKAARGIGGGIYPWGDSFDPSRANFCDRNCLREGANAGADDGWGETAPVGSFSPGASPYGALDLAGNVWEWVADWYAESYYAASSGIVENPAGPASGENRVLRGGSWGLNETKLRATKRNDGPPSTADEFVGFRCATTVTELSSEAVGGPGLEISPTPETLPATISMGPLEDPMVLVPAGPFIRGSELEEDEQPVLTVVLDDFYIDQYEVTNAGYEACILAGICEQPESPGSATRLNYYGDPEFSEYPVIWVSWFDAEMYCTWRGARLPTEAEWEKAARGTDGRVFPWGETFDPTLANMCDINCGQQEARTIYDDGYGDTAPVNTFPDGISPYGVYNMAGNVWEWIADWYAADYYASLGDAVENPKGPETGEFRILRGGSWENDVELLRTAHRGLTRPEQTFNSVGFRCAMSP